jgi:hypothetical protein
MEIERNAYNKKYKSYFLTEQEWQNIKSELVGATLHQTMGPCWRDIYWSPARRPYVLREKR